MITIIDGKVTVVFGEQELTVEELRTLLFDGNALLQQAVGVENYLNTKAVARSADDDLPF